MSWGRTRKSPCAATASHNMHRRGTAEKKRDEGQPLGIHLLVSREEGVPRGARPSPSLCGSRKSRRGRILKYDTTMRDVVTATAIRDHCCDARVLLRWLDPLDPARRATLPRSSPRSLSCSSTSRTYVCNPGHRHGGHRPEDYPPVAQRSPGTNAGERGPASHRVVRGARPLALPLAQK